MSFKRWLFVAIILFGIGLGLGLATPTGVLGLLSEDVAAVEEFADLLASLPRPSVVLIILVKNVSAVLISLALSPIFWLGPVMALVLNGWLLGVVSGAVLQEESLGYLMAGVVPHGIFELPALIMAEAVALSFGTAVILALFSAERRQLLLPNIKQNLRYLAVALSLFLPAAFLEAYVTPLLLR